MKRCPYRKIQSNFGGDIKDYFAECIGEDCVAFQKRTYTIVDEEEKMKQEKYNYCAFFKNNLD